MDNTERNTEFEDGVRQTTAVAFVLASTALVGVAAYGIGRKLKNWRRERKLDRMQEEYNKIWDEYKYYQGEESAD